MVTPYLTSVCGWKMHFLNSLSKNTQTVRFTWKTQEFVILWQFLHPIYCGDGRILLTLIFMLPKVHKKSVSKEWSTLHIQETNNPLWEVGESVYIAQPNHMSVGGRVPSKSVGRVTHPHPLSSACAMRSPERVSFYGSRKESIPLHIPLPITLRAHTSLLHIYRPITICPHPTPTCSMVDCCVHSRLWTPYVLWWRPSSSCHIYAKQPRGSLLGSICLESFGLSFILA
jgi:hypothetical protein